MEKIFKIELHKKIITLLTLFIFIIVISLSCAATLYFGLAVQKYLLFFSIVLLILWGYLMYSFVKTLLNFNKVYYLKLVENGFSYLHISKYSGRSRTLLIEVIESIYVKPKYFTISFLYIDSFRVSHKNKYEIEIIYENNRIERLPLIFSEENAKNAVLLLKNWLMNYKKS